MEKNKSVFCGAQDEESKTEIIRTCEEETHKCSSKKVGEVDNNKTNKK